MSSKHDSDTAGRRRGLAAASCERSEWRAVARPLALLVSAFGAGCWYTAHVTSEALGLPIAIAYTIALGWLARSVIGWTRGSAASLEGHALEDFRNRHFWSRPARWSYAGILVCDGLFLLDLNPDSPALFFLFAALSAVFSLEVGVLSIVLGAVQLL